MPVYSVLRRELLICHQLENDPDQTLTLQNYDSICWINGKFLLTAETYFIYLNVIPVPLVFRGSGKVRFSATSCLTSQNASLKSVLQLKCWTSNSHTQVTVVSKPSWCPGQLVYKTAAHLILVSNQNAQCSNTRKNVFGLTSTSELYSWEQADQHFTLVLNLLEKRNIWFNKIVNCIPNSRYTDVVKFG